MFLFQHNAKPTSIAPVQSSTNSVDTVTTKVPPDQVLKPSPAVDAGPSEVQPSASSKSDHLDVVKGEKQILIK